MTTERSQRIVVVDETGPQATTITSALRQAGYQVVHCTDSLSGLITLEEQRPDLVVLNWRMPFVDGAIFLQVLRIGLPTPPPVVVLAAPAVPVEVTRQAGAAARLPDLVDPPALVQTVRALLAARTTSTSAVA